MHSDAATGEALEPQRRQRVGRAHRQADDDRDRLDRALRDRQHDGQRRRRRHDRAPGLHRHLARRQRQERLVDAIDLDVLELVDADDVDVDREPRDQRPEQVEEPAVERQPRQRGDRDQVERDDADRRADDRVRAREAPQRAERPGRRQRDRAPGHRRRRSAQHGADRHEHEARQRAEHEAPGEGEAAQPVHGRLDVLEGLGERERRLPRHRLAPAHGDRVLRARVAVPAGRDRGHRDVLEAGALEPLAVLRLGREQHPQLGQPAQHRGRPAAPGPTTSATPPGFSTR